MFKRGIVSLFLLCLSGFAHADNYISVSVVQNKYIVFTDMKEMKVKTCYLWDSKEGIKNCSEWKSIK